MKVLLLLLLPFMALSQSWAAPAEAAKTQALAQALQKASAPIAAFYTDGYQNDTEKLLYHQAFNFLDLFPPQGKKSVFALTQADVPNTQIFIYTAPYAKLYTYIKAAGKAPQTVLPDGSNGVTFVAVDRKTGQKNLLVFVASDLIYMSIYDTRQNIPRREQELYSYKQSADFLARVAADPQVRAVPALVKALNAAKEEETYRHFVWGQKK